MKKCIVGICAIFTFALTIEAQEITFINLNQLSYASGEVENDVYDFGRIDEDGGIVSADIEFVNSGKKQLIISNIRTSTTALKVDWTSHPISAGAKGYLKIYYNPSNRPGRFFKTITIESNAKQEYKCRVVGEVIPKVTGSAE